MTRTELTNSRRAVLAGAGFFAGLTVAAPAVASITDEAGEDAAWREALTTLERAEAALDALSDHRAKVALAVADEIPPPAALVYWALDQETGRRERTHYWSERCIIERDRLAQDRFMRPREDQAETERLLAALRQWNAERDAAHERHGVPRLKVEMNDAAGKMEAAREALMRTPAPNALAIAEKLKRLYAYLDLNVIDPESVAFTLAAPEEHAGDMVALQLYLDALRVGGAEAQAAALLKRAAAVELPAPDEDKLVPEVDEDGFDPKDWLRRFRAIGGFAAVDERGQVPITFPKTITDLGNGETLTQSTPEALALWGEISGDISRLRAIQWQVRRGSGPDLTRSLGRAVAA